MRRARALLSLVALLAAAPAAAQTVVTSPGPEAVDVTIYRAPGRPPDQAFELDWLDGYALISESRRVSIPAGDSEIRFEGVAGGILPQSAIVRGFPDDIVERNQDAYLLAPESLLDRSLGRRVHLRRTSRTTGEVREHDAVIRSGADGAVVLETSEGFEALRCSGLAETLVYNRVPPGLSAQPTLSIRARSSQAATATVTLSYLASGFDWQANYIATLADDGHSVHLFAWLTLANGDQTSFVDADTQAVAGRLNREEVDVDWPAARSLELRCWPQGRTSDISPTVIASEQVRMTGTVRTEDFINELPQSFADEENIIVTGSSIARQEDLGDLKLYRIPEPVTVAANSQKQVAFLERSDVRVEMVYRQEIDVSSSIDEDEIERVLVTRNREQEGLGVPLPAGGVQLFARAGGRPILLGEGTVEDRAVGEDVEIVVGEAVALSAAVEEVDFGDDWEDYELTVANRTPEPVRYEAEFDIDEDVRFRPRQRLTRRDGRPLWSVEIPANGRAILRFRVVERDEDA